MAMEFVSSILVEIGKCLLGPVFEAVGQRVNNVVKVKENIEQLRKQVRELEKTKESVEKLIKKAERKGEDIKDNVTKWLEDVMSIIDETNSFIDNEIKENGSCFKGLYPNCGSRYQLSKKAGEKMKRIKELQEGGRFDVVSDPAPPLGIEFMCDRDFQMFKSRESAIKEIREALKDENVHVIGIYGMGGVGKTTLVTEIGKQVEKEKLFDKVVMAVVSQDPYLKQIQGEIARMLPLEFEEKENVLERAQKLSRKLQKEKSILIILDDMWKNLDLKQLGILLDLDDNKQRERRGCCKILLTTRSKDVCDVMVERNAIIRLDILSEEEAWGLFKRKVGDGVEQGDFHNVAREVVKECKGLPVAIVTVAGALRHKKDLQEWKDALEGLKRVEPQSVQGMDQQVYTCVRWSFDYLDDVETQRFFLYCCLFPEDYEIEIEEMMWYCFGAGVFENVETIEDARRKTRRIVNKLKASSLLLQGESQDFIKMHDIVRDVAISIVSRRVAVGNRSHHDELFMVRAGKGLTEWPRMESGIIKAAAGYTAISLMNNDIQKLPAADGLLESSSSGRLRTLLLQKYFRSSSKLEIPNTFFGGVIKSLTTLDLSNNIIGPSNLSSIQCLTNLLTLNLQGCRGLQQEISVLGSLNQLVILRLNRCNLERLPPDMARLTNLRVLDLSDNKGLIIPPNVISSWSHLEELYLFGSFCEWEQVQGIRTGEEQRAAASLAELKSLHGLTTLEVMVEVKNSSKSLRDGFVFQDLKRFFIVMHGDDGTMNYDFDWMTGISDYYRTNSPVNWLGFKNLPAQTIKVVCSNQLQRIQVLQLYDCNGVRSMEELDDKMGFNCLESLSICGCNEVEYLWPTHPISVLAKSSQLAVFTNLEKLHIESMQVLRGIICPAADQSLAKLKYLYVRRCPGLLNIVTPNLHQSLQKLETLEVKECMNMEVIFQFDQGLLSDDRHQGQAEAVPIVLSYGLLNYLKLRSLPKLTSIWNGSPQLLMNFPALNTLDLDGCQSLRSIFSCPSLKCLSSYQGAPNLETLSVFGCSSLKEIFHFEGIISDNHRQGQASAPIVLSYGLLDYMKLGYLPKLTSIWSGSPQLLVNFPALNTLDLDGCQSLRSIFSCPSLKCLSSYQGAPNLEWLSVFDCSSLEEIFHFEGILSNDHHQGQAAAPIVLSYGLLKYLTLTSLPKLTSIWSGSRQLLVNFPALNTLVLDGCQSLRNIFSVAMIPSLKCLKIRDCKKLEEIITKGKENEAEFCTTHHDPPQLQLVGLKELIIDSCPKIKCLGLSSQGAPKLETLVMKDCPLLEEIVEKEEGILKDVILFPNVTSLTVRYCPRLLRTPFGFATPSLFQAHPLCLIAPSNLKTVILGGFHGYRKIFSATIARALLQLEWLQVYDCSSVEEIFEDAVDKIAIIFPKLQWLEFEFLPSLIKIYGRNSSSDLFRCPLLKDVTIRECPKLLHFPFQRQSVPLLQEFRIVSYGLTMEELSNKYGKEMLESGKPLLRLISKDVENRFFLDLDE